MTAQDELMHYGVLGMKWGQRRAMNADYRIGQLNNLRSYNKNVVATADKSLETKYANKPNKLEKGKASNKAALKTTEVRNKYMIARQKAIKDPKYKESKDYIVAKHDFGKQYTQQMIYGTMGHQRIETLKNLGYSEGKAKGRAAAEQALIGLGVGLTMGAISYAMNN